MLKSQEIEKIIEKLPKSPGVYRFLDKNNKILYIGKATSLKNRVRSYFIKDIAEKRSPLIEKMVEEAVNIKFTKTNSVLEALILEVNEIKKWQPTYNTAEKDQKSFNYVVITNEKFPRVLIVRERELEIETRLNGEIEQNPKFKIKYEFGPFPHSTELKTALKIVRKIFPFRDKCSPPKKDGKEQPCFNYQIGLCPGVCVGKMTEKEYKKTIENIKTFFQGNTNKLIKKLEKEMTENAKKREFEKANQIKRKIFALKHIQDVALIQNPDSLKVREGFRIEAFDIAHISNTNVVGVMTVIEDGLPNKKEYRVFKISKENSKGDTNSLRELLERRFKHSEWIFPKMIVMDGGVAQLNTARDVLNTLNQNIPIVSVVKNEKHKPKEILNIEEAKKIYPEIEEKNVLLANSESHRFAINFHRKQRDRNFI